jgi:uncharacterized protein (DUF1778 family)
MSAKSEKIKLRLTPEEKAKIEHDAALCGLTQSEYVRQICLGKQPRAKQPVEFWTLMDALYEVHSTLEQLAAYYPETAEGCRDIERTVLFLQEAV